TRGTVLREEISAVQEVTDLLTLDARHASRVAPWSQFCHGLQGLETLGALRNSAGTEPNSLFDNSTVLKALNSTNVWWLLTDGEISQGSIERFSVNISRARLHGKACVIILFGHRKPKPEDCNISVGVSLFALVPDCLFLFHDVKTHEVFVLQSKGALGSINNHQSVSQEINDWTTWSDLKTIRYSDFGNITIPEPAKLDAGEVMLQDGSKVSLAQLYRDEINGEQVRTILGNDDNLNTVMLTATARGEANLVEDWLKGQRRLPPEAINAYRVDVEKKAEHCQPYCRQAHELWVSA
ncbi:uncharacterized protein A1O5_13389, partial [Cladophialophora psammophila CBS 110553]